MRAPTRPTRSTRSTRPTRSTRSRPTRAVGLAALMLLAPGLARAGAFGRPNQIDARAVGVGGAFTGLADDPTAVWFNPAGLAQIRETTLLAGLELVSVGFHYTPSTCSPGGMTSTSCPEINMSELLPLPTLGFSTRFASRGGHDASRLALGFGSFVTMGGVVDFDQAALVNAGEQRGIIHAQVALYEMVPSLAYKVNDALAVGVSLRAGVMGLGLTNFELRQLAHPVDAELSGSGAGFGFGLGVLVRPLSWLQVGANYRSRLSVTVTGDGTIPLTQGATPQRVGFTLTVPWPQAFSVGAAATLAPGLRLLSSVDWTDWSSFDALAPQFSDPNLNANGRLLLDYRDSYTVHAGAEYALGEAGAVRAGYAFDSAAIPDRTLDRQLQDGPRHTVGGGGGLRLGGRIWIDLAGELFFGSTRVVLDNSMSVPRYQANTAPGRYSATLISVELTGRYQF